MVSFPTFHVMKLMERENWNWKQKVTLISLESRIMWSTEKRIKGQNYIRATKPHSTIAFNFTTSLRTVELQYLRSAIFGLGSVKCWVDDDVEMAVTVVAYWKEIVNIGRYVLPLPLQYTSCYKILPIPLHPTS